MLHIYFMSSQLCFFFNYYRDISLACLQLYYSKYIIPIFVPLKTS